MSPIDSSQLYETNYTHNCNRMAAHVLRSIGTEMPAAWWDGDKPGTCWWAVLDGMTAPDGYQLLDIIIGGLAEAPEFFREMNPYNGWGDFDSFMERLHEMRGRSAENPSARWMVHG